MFISIDKYKGISPGKIISYELNKKGISQREFARQINAHNQTLNAVINGKRKLTTELAIKIERSLGLEEGFLLILQTYYSIEQYKKFYEKKLDRKPNIRKIIFWDTDFNTIDWIKYKNMVIKRVFERGNREEKEEIARYYGISFDEANKIYEHLISGH